jgi:hypothetical protein
MVCQFCSWVLCNVVSTCPMTSLSVCVRRITTHSSSTCDYGAPTSKHISLVFSATLQQTPSILHPRWYVVLSYAYAWTCASTCLSLRLCCMCASCVYRVRTDSLSGRTGRLSTRMNVSSWPTNISRFGYRAFHLAALSSIDGVSYGCYC